MHYTSVKLTNFRGFCDTPSIPLAPLTFLVGPNSSGKSSIFDALLLLAQSGFDPIAPTVKLPNWQGSLVDLGSYKDAVYRHEPSRKIIIAVNIATDSDERTYQSSKQPTPSGEGRFLFQMVSSGRNDPIGRLACLVITDVPTKQAITFRHSGTVSGQIAVNFLGRRRIRRLDPYLSKFYFSHWLSAQMQSIGRERRGADRTAAQRLSYFAATPAFGHFISNTQRISSGRLGPKRWYSATGVTPVVRRGLYDAVDPQMIDEVQRPDDGETKKLGARQRQRLGRFLKELEIASEVQDVKLSPYHSAINVKDSITKIVSNLIDVGYGASQVLPVIIGCFSPSTSPLLVEQPEIHLHPRAQGTVAELLCSTSRHRQVIIETHSEHMINRARILVAQGKIPAENVIINYISRKREGSFVKPITVEPNGDFGGAWPAGFFDERYQDTMRLLELKNRPGKLRRSSGRRS